MICNTYKTFFRTMCDPAKIELLFELRKAPNTVSELIKATDLEQSNVSHHLKTFREIGLVTVEVKGKQRVYSLKDDMKKLLGMVDKHVDDYYHQFCKCNGPNKKKRWEGRTKGGMRK